MKKKLFLILSCLIGPLSLAKNEVKLKRPSIKSKQSLDKDNILSYLKKKNIISFIRGVTLPLINYQKLALELKKKGKSNNEIQFDIENFSEAFKVHLEEERPLQEILDEMGVLDRDDLSMERGHQCVGL